MNSCMQFFGKIGKIVCWGPQEGRHPALRGIPDSSLVRITNTNGVSRLYMELIIPRDCQLSFICPGPPKNLEEIIEVTYQTYVTEGYPRGFKFFQFHAVFGTIWQNRMLAHPGGLALPPLGNPGSTTGYKSIPEAQE